MVTRVFDPVQYCPLVLRRFQTVEIDIRDATGVKASPTILGSTSGQYTYREFTPLVTSAT
jgi:hypothetical protein